MIAVLADVVARTWGAGDWIGRACMCVAMGALLIAADAPDTTDYSDEIERNEKRRNELRQREAAG